MAFITSLVASTIVALTLTPVLCSWLLGGNGKSDTSEPVVERKMKAAYSRATGWAMRRKKGVIAVTSAILVAALAIFFSLGSNFLPRSTRALSP